MSKPETALAAHATYSVPSLPLTTPRGTTVVEPSRFYPHYYEPQYVQPTPQYVQPTPQYVQPTPQYVQPTPQYVQPTPQYVQPTPQYVQPTPQYATEQYQFPQFPQFPQYPQYQYPPQYYPQYHQYPPQYYPQFPQQPQYLPDGCYCEIQYVIPYIVSKSNSPVSSSQPPETQQESLVVSM